MPLQTWKLEAENEHVICKAILKEKRDHHSQVACRKVFEFTHPEVSLELLNTVGRHPNAYFEASLKYY